MKKTPAKNKKIIAAVAAVIAAVVAIFLVMRFMPSKSTNVSGKAFVKAVNSVNKADLTSINRFSGKVETQKTEKIKLDSSMTLGECYVQKEQHVEEGDRLFSYDAQSLQIEVQQKQLEIERLNTTISNDNAQIATLTEQMNKAPASEQIGFSSQILELQAEVAQSEYSIKVAQAEIDKKNKSIENSTVTAPIAGTVTELNDVSLVSDDTPYMTITADGEFRIKAKVSEQNIIDISEGEKVLVRSRIDESKTWTGKVSVIEKQATADQENIYYGGDSGNTASNYSFYVELDSIEGLMLGQHVIIEEYIGQDELGDGIWLTSGWITKEDGKSYVWASSSAEGRLEKREVVLGEYKEEADIYEIKSGLSDTDYIAWPDDDYKEGMQVAVKQAETESSSSSGSDGAEGDDQGTVTEGGNETGGGTIDEGMLYNGGMTDSKEAGSETG